MATMNTLPDRVDAETLEKALRAAMYARLGLDASQRENAALRAEIARLRAELEAAQPRRAANDGDFFGRNGPRPALQPARLHAAHRFDVA
jgi:hypothetical protein